MKCPRCATDNHPQAAFCNRCGIQFLGAAAPKQKSGAVTAGVIAGGILLLLVLVCVMCGVIGNRKDNNSVTAVNSTPVAPPSPIDTSPTASPKPLTAAEQRKVEANRLAQVKKNEAGEREAKKLLRQALIDKLEKDLLSKGMDFYFSFEGKESDTLRVKYILMSRPVVHMITNDTDFVSSMGKLGVKKIVFTDGYNETWTQDTGY